MSRGLEPAASAEFRELRERRPPPHPRHAPPACAAPPGGAPRPVGQLVGQNLSWPTNKTSTSLPKLTNLTHLTAILSNFLNSLQKCCQKMAKMLPEELLRCHLLRSLSKRRPAPARRRRRGSPRGPAPSRRGPGASRTRRPRPGGPAILHRVPS